MDKVDYVAASDLVSASVLAALVARLRRIGVFSPEDVREVYEHALRLIEQRAGTAPDEMQLVMRAAREVIEEQLRG
jgi:hypothetical protein